MIWRWQIKEEPEAAFVFEKSHLRRLILLLLHNKCNNDYYVQYYYLHLFTCRLMIWMKMCETCTAFKRTHYIVVGRIKWPLGRIITHRLYSRLTDGLGSTSWWIDWAMGWEWFIIFGCLFMRHLFKSTTIYEPIKGVNYRNYYYIHRG